jgi:hypothetical protein
MRHEDLMDWTPAGEMEVNALKRQVTTLRRQVQALEEWVDVLGTPIHCKLWFWLQGYRLWRVGRWYKKTPDLQ